MIDHVFVDLNYVVRPWESVGDRVHLVHSHKAANIFARVAIIDFEINGTERFRRDNLGTDIHFPEDASQLNNKLEKYYLFKMVSFNDLLISRWQTVLLDTWQWTAIIPCLCEFTRDSLFGSLTGSLRAPCKLNVAYLQVQIFRKGVIVHKNDGSFCFPIEWIIFVRSRIFIFCFREIARK